MNGWPNTMKSAPAIPSLMINWATTSAVGAAIAAVKASATIAQEVIAQESRDEALLHSGGIGFLLSLEDVARRKVN
jgi:hypothetical protein